MTEAERERAAIVAWLRKLESAPPARSKAVRLANAYVKVLATAIERGEHERTEG